MSSVKMGTPSDFYQSPPLYQNNNETNFYGTGRPTPINNIAEFYKGTRVFITGATGFVGKALVEKLLRTCQNIEAIYVLVRPKRGMAVEQRLKELFRNPVFDRIREKNPEAFEKVKAVCGDVSQPNLGLADKDTAHLISSVDIVFHSAATVKFNEDLKNAVVLNTLGTKRVLELCHQMAQLKSFVHVSTAYSNSDKEIIEEKVYDPPHDPQSVMNCVEILPQDSVNELAPQLMGNHPNTYTLTKAMAEHLVLESSSKIPSAIVRPSIITAAWKEPFPGWVDNVSGITGIFMECGRGTIKSIICDEKCKMDLIPVDIVVNTIVTAAWHTVAYSSNVIRVYNCTSGSINPISWKRFGALTHKYWLEYPSKYVTWYPGFTYRTNRFVHVIMAAMFHLAPAAILDVFLYCTRQKPIMLKIGKKFVGALEAGKFFSLNQWEFGTGNMADLIRAVGNAEDCTNFEVNLDAANGFDWDSYLKDFTLGVRRYVLKDDLDSLPQAKTKLNRLFWFQKFVQVATVYALAKLLLHRC